MAGEDDQRRHLILSGITRTDRYKSPRQIVAAPTIPGRNRSQHAAQLRQALQGVQAAVDAARQAQAAISPARYALLISIRAPATEVDLYSAIESKIAQPIMIATDDRA